MNFHRLILIIGICSVGIARAEVASEGEVLNANFSPVLLHAPIHHAVAGQAILVQTTLTGHWKLGTVRFRYRNSARGAWQTLELARSGEHFVTTVPKTHVRTGLFQYYLESTDPSGTVRRHFAQADDPHTILVQSTAAIDRKAARLRRYRGKRSQVAARGEYFAYGSRLGDGAYTLPNDGVERQVKRHTDRYWRGELEYTQRALNEVVHDFRFGIGVMRAEWPTVESTDGSPLPDTAKLPDAPGINYGFGEINFQSTDWLTLGGRVLLGASAKGFVGGVGAVARIGNPAGTHFATQVDVIGDIGVRTDFRLHWDTVPNVPMALGLELTNWPSREHASDAANLSYDIGYRFDGGAAVTARIGTAKRAKSIDGGFQTGLQCSYDF